MSSLPSLTAIANGDTASATPVDGNFDILAAFVDAELINRDGSIAMAADLAMGSNRVTGLATPSSSTDAATKAYVDDSTLTSYFTRTTNIAVSASGSGTVTFENETNDSDGWWSSGTTFTCPATGFYSLVASVEKSAGAGTISPNIAPSWKSGGTLGGTPSGSSTTGRGDVSASLYIKAGDTFTIGYSNGSAVDTATITNVFLAITKVYTI